MATATKDVEQIVRKVVSEELDEAVNAIQELSTLLTDQVIPKLSGDEDSDDVDDDDEPVDDCDEDEDGAVSMSAFNRANGKATRRRRTPANGHDDGEDSGDTGDPGKGSARGGSDGVRRVLQDAVTRTGKGAC